jgi:hypothetical protein
VRHRRHVSFAGHSGGSRSRRTRLGLLARTGAESSVSSAARNAEGYGGGVPLYSNATTRSELARILGRKTDRLGRPSRRHRLLGDRRQRHGAQQSDAARIQLACEYKDGYPVVDDRYNVATSFTIRADMPNNVEMIITSEGDNGILFEGTKGGSSSTAAGSPESRSRT